MHEPGDKEPVILNVGRFFAADAGHSKKQLELVQAFRRLRRRASGLDAAPGRRLLRRRARLPRAGAAAAPGYPVELHVNATGESCEALYARASIYWHAAGLRRGRPPPPRPARALRHLDRRGHVGRRGAGGDRPGRPARDRAPRRRRLPLPDARRALRPSPRRSSATRRCGRDVGLGRGRAQEFSLDAFEGPAPYVGRPASSAPHAAIVARPTSQERATLSWSGAVGLPGRQAGRSARGGRSAEDAAGPGALECGASRASPVHARSSCLEVTQPGLQVVAAWGALEVGERPRRSRFSPRSLTSSTWSLAAAIAAAPAPQGGGHRGPQVVGGRRDVRRRSPPPGCRRRRHRRGGRRSVRCTGGVSAQGIGGAALGRRPTSSATRSKWRSMRASISAGAGGGRRPSRSAAHESGRRARGGPRVLGADQVGEARAWPGRRGRR